MIPNTGGTDAGDPHMARDLRDRDGGRAVPDAGTAPVNERTRWVGNALIALGCALVIYGQRQYVTRGMVALAVMIGLLVMGAVGAIRDSRERAAQGFDRPDDDPGTA